MWRDNISGLINSAAAVDSLPVGSLIICKTGWTMSVEGRLPMHEIDLNTWRRRRFFDFFNNFDHPHFNLCANLELTAFKKQVKNSRTSFTVAFVYVIALAANAIPEFRYRIHSGRVIEHDIVNPSITILVDDDLFSFCTIPFAEDFTDFADRATANIAHVKEHPNLENEPDRDDLLYMTAIPWVSFTSFMHPMQLHPADSIPRFAWGRIFHDGQELKIPLSVQGHHALMDGIHMGKFYAIVEEYLQHPEKVVFGR
jgi:chloramphenicol O-acetyltransferase type A